MGSRECAVQTKWKGAWQRMGVRGISRRGQEVRSKGVERQRERIWESSKGEENEHQARGKAPRKGAIARCIIEHRDALRSE